MRQPHPIAALLRECGASGREATKSELDALELPAGDRAEVAKASREAAFFWDAGERQRSREHARQRASEIVSQLPEELQDTTPADPLADEADPRKLAAAVRPW